MLSHPTWVRGLKRSGKDANGKEWKVAPYVGAWIETVIVIDYRFEFLVAPYVGAWIETSCKR